MLMQIKFSSKNSTMTWQNYYNFFKFIQPISYFAEKQNRNVLLVFRGSFGVGKGEGVKISTGNYLAVHLFRICFVCVYGLLFFFIVFFPVVIFLGWGYAFVARLNL